MPRALVASLLVASAALGAALVLVVRTLPPRAVALVPALPPTIVLGGYHIHSNRSDGSGSVDAIAAAAHDAGLSFIILTDHGDGTTPPLAPAYRAGVLCIDAVEISTNGGHVVALGLNDATPYPLAGEPADVVDDIHRFGGAAIVAHPDSPKADLQWHAWNTPYDGIEWLNADSEWRARTSGRLSLLAGQLLLRPAETVASLFRRPTPTLRRWEGVIARRPVIAVAGLDAHANLAGWPRYADMFRALAQAVVLDAAMSGRAVDDARAVESALRAGKTYSLVRAFASPAELDFSATSRAGTASMGGALPAGDTISWQAAVPQAPAARVALVSGGREVAGGRGRVSYTGPGRPGAVHVEVTYPGSLMPWILSNPIYVGEPAGADVPAQEGPEPPLTADRLDLLGSSKWHVEHDARSTGDIETSAGALAFRYALGTGAPAGQFVAAVVPTESTAGVDRVLLGIRADRAIRISVQVKLAGPAGGQRWRRSAYVDAQTSALVLPLSSFVAADRPTSQQPIVSVIRELLIVVDTVNAAPGTHGMIWMTMAGLNRATSER